MVGGLLVPPTFGSVADTYRRYLKMRELKPHPKMRFINCFAWATSPFTTISFQRAKSALSRCSLKSSLIGGGGDRKMPVPLKKPPQPAYSVNGANLTPTASP